MEERGTQKKKKRKKKKERRRRPLVALALVTLEKALVTFCGSWWQEGGKEWHGEVLKIQAFNLFIKIARLNK